MRRAAHLCNIAAAGAEVCLLAVITLALTGCTSGCGQAPEAGYEWCHKCYELWVWRENWDSSDVHIHGSTAGLSASPSNRVPAGTWELDKSSRCYVDEDLPYSDCEAAVKAAREDGHTFTYYASRNGEQLASVTFTVRLGDENEQQQVKYTVAWTGSTLTATKNE